MKHLGTWVYKSEPGVEPDEFALCEHEEGGLWVRYNTMQIRLHPAAYGAIVREILDRANPDLRRQIAEYVQVDAELAAPSPTSDAIPSHAWRCGDERLRAAWIARLIDRHPAIGTAENIEQLQALAYEAGRDCIEALAEDLPF